MDAGVGIVSQGTCVDDEYGNLHFLNEHGFYRLTAPNAAPVRISGAIEGFINSINFGVAHLFTSVRVASLKEIWWCVAVNGSNFPNIIIRYNYLYKTPDNVGTWWPLDLNNVRSVWEYENGSDRQQIRGGDNAGFEYNMMSGLYDNDGSYNSHFVLDNLRHRDGGYGMWDWLIGRFDNVGNWNLNFEFYPGGMRNSPHFTTTTTALTDDSITDGTFYNRQTVERQIPLSGLTANVLGMKVYNNTGGQDFGVHELGAIVRPAGIFR